MPRIVLQVDGLPETALDLEIDDGKIRQIHEQRGRLAERGINLSPRAYFFSILAVEAIASEPARDWPGPLNEAHSDDSQELQSKFIDALGYHLFTQARGLSNADGKTDIQIFDAIRHLAELSWECRCIFRVPRQKPA